MSRNQIPERFRSLREASGLTQGQVAEYLGVDQSFISKCEKGERQFTTDILERAGWLFGCTLDYFSQIEPGFRPIPMAFRARGVTNEDLEVIAVMNRISLNLRFMEDRLQGEPR